MLKGHGGEIFSIARKKGIEPSLLLDFSTNVSPLPLPNGLKELITANIDQIQALPEVDSAGLRLALSSRFGLNTENFLVSSGTTHWIYALPRALCPSRIIVPVPTYSDYVDAATTAGVQVLKIRAWDNGKPVGLRKVLELAVSASRRGDMVFICNPNNPTGTYASPRIIADAVRSCPEITWVIDESYAPFIAEDEESSMLFETLPDNCLVLRSFSKIFGIPGLRLGYLAGSASLLEKFDLWIQPWQVNRLAQIAGEWLLQDNKYSNEVRRFWTLEKRRFLERVSGCTLIEYVPGETHFMLFKLKSGWSSEKLCSVLLERNMVIRDCANFQGLDGGDYVRISLRGADENARLASALREVEKVQ